MNIMEDEIKKLGGNEAWLAAKVPEFYERSDGLLLPEKKPRTYLIVLHVRNTAMNAPRRSCIKFFRYH